MNTTKFCICAECGANRRRNKRLILWAIYLGAFAAFNAALLISATIKGF